MNNNSVRNKLVINQCGFCSGNFFLGREDMVKESHVRAVANITLDNGKVMAIVVTKPNSRVRDQKSFSLAGSGLSDIAVGDYLSKQLMRVLGAPRGSKFYLPFHKGERKSDKLGFVTPVV